MTERLYYANSYRRSFDAKVVSCDERHGRVEVVLNRTIFYPTSGGQPFDLGRLNGEGVREVVERDDGEVVHVVDRRFAVGESVAGEIDWTRRFDHMQQHSGQHLLSAAYDRLFAVRTESFHLGPVAATIDLAREVTVDEVHAAEAEANSIVWSDGEVSVRTVSAAEAMTLPLRKESQRAGDLRLVDIAGFDLSACGGTHVARTGAVGVIVTAGWQKFRGGTRLEFLCGQRAVTRFAEWRDALAAVTRQVSVPAAELASAVDKLQAENKQLHRMVRGQVEQLAAHEGRAMLARARRIGPRRVVVEMVEGSDASVLKALATAAVAEAPDALVVLFGRAAVSQGTASVTAAPPALVVVAGGADASIDANAVVKALIAQFGGRGGGRRDLAQAGGLVGGTTELITAAEQSIAQFGGRGLQ